jgi:phosphoserine phosphatase
MRIPRVLATVALCVLAFLTSTSARGSDPLPSWREGKTKQAILDFVAATTTAGNPGYVPPAERIAVFDNDGTLWSEQPAYFQVFFIVDRVRALAPAHPEWKQTEPFASILRGDLKAAMAGGERGLMQLAMATHAGMDTEEFATLVREWVRTARHPVNGRPFTAMVYQPMLEVLSWLRANGYRTWIVSGGGIEFMRPWVEEVYGVPPEQVIGSSIRTRLAMTDKGPVLQRLPELEFVDDKEGKPIAINSRIGRRPVAAFGNSDGDLNMLQWTMAGTGKRFALYVQHTDAEREWAYGRESAIGRLDKGLDEALSRGWTLVDMKRDWKTIYPLHPDRSRR